MRSLPIGAILFCASMLAWGQADNTKMNKRDGAAKPLSAEQQMENKSDLELTRKIRKSLSDDKSLSTYAKNVKIISRLGNVTLKGPVNTEEEKLKIEKVAKAIAGDMKVNNEIEIVKKSKEN